ncbi:MAG: hypothetical protein KY455_09260 [Euryarchaeota archaeon]|nr:hypothetical protein [Euryarchaeota archaeon]
MHPLRVITGLTLFGYGLLILIGVLPHDSFIAGVASLLIGAVLLAPGLPALAMERRAAVIVIGSGAAGGVLLYNLVVGSSLGAPEVGLLVYGTVLLFAAPRLEHRLGPTTVGTIVGWSFPLLLAPLLLFALNAVITGPAGGGGGPIATPAIHYGLVLPLASALAIIGTPSEVVANNIILETPRGGLTLGVGLVCAGLYPMVLFLGVLALHAWRTRLPPRRTALYLGLGAVGLWMTNIIRMMILAEVGIRWGGATLQTVHSHIGWILFAIFMAGYWALVLRHLERPDPLDKRPT